MSSSRITFVALISFFLFFVPSQSLLAQASGVVKSLRHLVPPEGGSYVAGAWGWTDPVSHREYAILGSYCGTSIVEISATNVLTEVEFIPGPCNSWREVQVYDHYAYVVTEAGGGTQIIDLSTLPDSARLVQSFIYTLDWRSTSRVHTNHIRDGYLYLVGCATWSPGGIVIFSLADPENPAYVGQYNPLYYHDIFVRGDTLFGAAIYGVGIDIISVADKSNPQFLSRITYSGSGTHNLATTIDGRYVLSTDEINATPKTLKVWDLATAPAFTKVAEYTGDPASIVHNVFVKDTFAIMSYYTAGMKIVSVARPANPLELGGYDTYSGPSGGYEGAWSVYPFFPSGKIIIGDMSTGLYVVHNATQTPKPPSSFTPYSDYSMPGSARLKWNDPTGYVLGNKTLLSFTVRIYRDGEYIGDVGNGVRQYIDTGLTPRQQYTYTIRTAASSGISLPSAGAVYAGGHPQPKAPTSLAAAHAPAGGTIISWTTPKRQIDNSPLNDLACVLVYRDGILADSVSLTSADTGQVRSYNDTAGGYHTYFVRARDNETPVNYSPSSDTILASGTVFASYSEDFEDGGASVYRDGAWDTTRSIAAGGISCITDNPAGDYENGANTSFLTPPVRIDSTSLLRFSHIAIVAPGDTAFLEISVDERKTFTTLARYTGSLHPQWSDGQAGAGDWFTQLLNLSSFEGDTVVVRFRLQTAYAATAEGWFIDNILIGPVNGDVSTGRFSVNEGWNMVSLPYEMSDHSRPAVFPASVSRAFRYDGIYRGDPDTLSFGSGYWVKFDTLRTLDLAGTAVRLDTIGVEPGWNMIGALSDAVDTANISTIPGDIVGGKYYGYEEEGYFAAGTLQPGRAYWVKASSAGQIVLSAVGGSPAPAAAKAGKEILPAGGTKAIHTLAVRDAQGRTRTLFFGREGNAAIDPALFELPPVPPEGSLDVRFSSQRSLVLAENNAKGKHPILIQASRYPLTLRWTVKEEDKTSWALRNGTERSPVKGEGSLVLTSPSSLVLVSGEEEAATVLPKVFSLAQNYPNPFNPSTQIAFALPAVSFVTLSVYNVYGQEVALLVNEERQAGEHTIEFTGSMLASGVYYYRLTAAHAGGQYSETRKLTVIK